MDSPAAKEVPKGIAWKLTQRNLDEENELVNNGSNIVSCGESMK
jgi:hypothetical protein